MTAGIIGATGYAGAELVRLLSGHPKVGNFILSSVSFEGERMEDVYPNLLGVVRAPLVKSDEVCRQADVVFSALPAGVGEAFALICAERGAPFIDLSADFRFDDDEAAYTAWYGKPYTHADLHKRSVYGLPELNRQRIAQAAASGAAIIGNPGCYPTGATLGAFPALAQALACGTVIVDSASGVSGGGREPSRSFHYPECADSLTPYKVGSHRHTPEIARNFSAIASRNGQDAPAVIFTPHLSPMNRGILSTIYIPLAQDWQAQPGAATASLRVLPPSAAIEEKTAAIRALYEDFYRAEPFVRVLPAGLTASTNRVRQSNYCDISVHLDCSGSTLIITSAIDNMVKDRKSVV